MTENEDSSTKSILLTTIIASVVVATIGELFRNMLNSIIVRFWEKLLRLLFADESELIIDQIIDSSVVHYGTSSYALNNTVFSKMVQWLENNDHMKLPHEEHVGLVKYKDFKIHHYDLDYHMFHDLVINFENRKIITSCTRREITIDNDRTGRQVQSKLVEMRRITIKVKSSSWFCRTSDRKGDNEYLKKFINYCISQVDGDVYYDNPIQIFQNKEFGYGFCLPPQSETRPNIEERLFLDPKTKNSLIDDVKTFVEGEDYYRCLNKIYARTYLLCGPPGTGKSQMIKEICKEHKIQMSYISDLMPSTLSEARHFAKYNPKCRDSRLRALIIEDIDLLLEERRKSTNSDDKEEEFNMSTLMCLLDGSMGQYGLLIFITSNYPERIDPRLLRPGRINRRFDIATLTNPDEIERLIRWQLYNRCNISDQNIIDTAKFFSENDTTLAEIVNVCEQKFGDPNIDMIESMTNLKRLIKNCKEENLEHTLEILNRSKDSVFLDGVGFVPIQELA